MRVWTIFDIFIYDKTECGCPIGGGIKNGHILWRNAEKEKELFKYYIILIGAFIDLNLSKLVQSAAGLKSLN